MPADAYRARLIAAREKLKLSRREMAKRLLTPRNTYEQWETGARRTPGVAVVAAERIAIELPADLTYRVKSLASPQLSAKDIADLLGVDRKRVGAVFRAAKRYGAELPRRYDTPPRKQVRLDQSRIEAAVRKIELEALGPTEAARAVGLISASQKITAAMQHHINRLCRERGIAIPIRHGRRKSHPALRNMDRH